MYYAGTPAPQYYTSSGWDPWRCDTKAPANPRQFTWPIRRVTFREPATGYHMSRSLAEVYFAGTSDLVYEFPQRADRPAAQVLEMVKLDDGTQAALARRWAGDYSWIVTVAPSTAEARNGMATNPEGFAYNVSTVVFYKRSLPSGYPSSNLDLGANVALEQSVGRDGAIYRNERRRAIAARFCEQRERISEPKDRPMDYALRAASEQHP